MICKLCEKEVQRPLTHFKCYHPEINTTEYYDNYLKKENEGKCLKCGKQTPFVNFNLGYRPYCCRKCAQSDPAVLQKKSDTYFEKTGYRHNTQNPNYHNENSFANPEVQKKALETRSKRSEEDEQKRIDAIASTCKEKYGVSCVFQSEEIKNQIRTTKLERYGDEHFNGHIVKEKNETD